MPEHDGQQFSPREVAELLGESEATVTWWTEHHTLPAFIAPDGESKIRRVDLIPFARPLVDPWVLDAIEPLDQDLDLAAVRDMSAFAEF